MLTAAHGCGVPESPLTLSCFEWYFSAAAKYCDQAAAAADAHLHSSVEYSGLIRVLNAETDLKIQPHALSQGIFSDVVHSGW